MRASLPVLILLLASAPGLCAQQAPKPISPRPAQVALPPGDSGSTRSIFHPNERTSGSERTPVSERLAAPGGRSVDPGMVAGAFGAALGAIIVFGVADLLLGSSQHGGGSSPVVGVAIVGAVLAVGAAIMDRTP